MHLKVFIMMSSSKKKVNKNIMSICSWSNILTGKLHVNELCNERYCYHKLSLAKTQTCVVIWPQFSCFDPQISALGRTVLISKPLFIKSLTQYSNLQCDIVKTLYMLFCVNNANQIHYLVEMLPLHNSTQCSVSMN